MEIAWTSKSTGVQSAVGLSTVALLVLLPAATWTWFIPWILFEKKSICRLGSREREIDRKVVVFREVELRIYQEVEVRLKLTCVFLFFVAPRPCVKIHEVF